MPRYVHIPSTKQTLGGYNNDIILWESKDISVQKLDFYDEVSHKNYSHIDGLVNGVDIKGQIHNLSVKTVNGQQWYVIADENSKSEGFGYIFKRIKDWLGDSVWYIIKIILFIILDIILIYGCI